MLRDCKARKEEILHQQKRSSYRNIHPDSYKGKEDEIKQRLMAVFKKQGPREKLSVTACLSATGRKSTGSSIQSDAGRFARESGSTTDCAGLMDGSQDSASASTSQIGRPLSKLNKHQRKSAPSFEGGSKSTAARLLSALIRSLVGLLTTSPLISSASGDSSCQRSPIWTRRLSPTSF